MSLTLAATLDLIDDLRRRGDAFCTVTVVRTANATSAKAGAKAVVTADGVLHGFVGGGCVQGAVKKAALEVLEAGEPRLMRVKPKDEVEQPTDEDGIELHGSSCPSGGTVEFFLEPIRQQMRILIIGKAPVAAALTRLGQAMGCAIIERDPAKDQDLADRADLVDLDLQQRDAIVVATQGKRDRQALEAALRSKAGYIGMIGSRKKIKTLLDQTADDIPDERKRQLHGPAGLDIGAIEPEEIALSILAQITQRRRQVAVV